jgi:hypothetical protein
VRSRPFNSDFTTKIYAFRKYFIHPI